MADDPNLRPYGLHEDRVYNTPAGLRRRLLLCAPLVVQLLLIAAGLGCNAGWLPSGADDLLVSWGWIPSLLALIATYAVFAALGQRRKAIDAVSAALNATIGFLGLAFWGFLAWIIPAMGV